MGSLIVFALSVKIECIAHLCDSNADEEHAQKTKNMVNHLRTSY
nr:MAG TPA: hypothetical protein [Caudoviricetes sp.]